MTTIDEKLKTRQDTLATKQAENALLERQLQENEEKMLELAEQVGLAQESLAFLEDVANSRRGSMKGKIEDVVTEALQLIYGQKYRVELVYTVKNNRSHLAIEMVRDIPEGEVRRDPTEGAGGGVSDTISVPLRLMVMLGSRQTDKVCILDECWKHVDPERVELVGQFLKVLTERLGIQVLLCSHHITMRTYADQTYEVSEIEGRSELSVV